MNLRPTRFGPLLTKNHYFFLFFQPKITNSFKKNMKKMHFSTHVFNLCILILGFVPPHFERIYNDWVDSEAKKSLMKTQSHTSCSWPALQSEDCEPAILTSDSPTKKCHKRWKKSPTYYLAIDSESIKNKTFFLLWHILTILLELITIWSRFLIFFFIRSQSSL